MGFSQSANSHRFGTPDRRSFLSSKLIIHLQVARLARDRVHLECAYRHRAGELLVRHSHVKFQQMNLIRSVGLGSPYPRSVSIDLGLLLIRLATGIFLCTVFEKFLPRDGRWGPQDWFIADVAKMGFPFPIFFAWCAVLSEFFGGILLALGLLARPAAFFNAITTFVAAFVFHKGDVSGGALLGTVFFASTLGLTLTGPGRISIDYLMFCFWTTASTTEEPSDARKSPVAREFES